MTALHPHRNVPTESSLHPAVQRALIGCVLWIVAALWLFFGRDAYAGLQLAVSTFFCVMFVAVPMWMAKLTPAAASQPGQPSIREWASHEFETACGSVEGRDAIAMILLAPVAIALGITGVSLVAYLAAKGVL